MSPDQGSEALFEGSKRNSGYQTVSKFYNLIVESSGSTRRIQRAQDRKNPTSVGQEIVHRTIHDQGVQYRPSDPRLKESKETQDRSCTLAPPRPPPDHRSKALHFVGPPAEGPTLGRTTAGPPAEGPILSRTTAGPPVEGPTLCRTTSRRPYTSPDLRRTTSRRPYTLPDHQPKALYFAGPPPEGPTLRSRPEVQPKALHPAQGPKSSLRPYAPLKARSSAYGHTLRSRPNIPPGYCRTSARRRSSDRQLTNARTSKSHQCTIRPSRDTESNSILVSLVSGGMGKSREDGNGVHGSAAVRLVFLMEDDVWSLLPLGRPLATVKLHGWPFLGNRFSSGWPSGNQGQLGLYDLSSADAYLLSC
ncbi:hypothetical protein M5K25_017374 [Dendrobium thyrsiflorum]|uniref:Uncharacterized protein n=1 Tax=Dendrobium thyrsiflorum TaxID=117978 RepID=A0ABD0UTY3_DENTH